MGNATLISPTEATNRLGISYSSFLRQIRKGTIPYVKIGKQIRVPESYFDSLENEAMSRGREL
jgi:excisionase family DNA binding protein